ncbi:MAG TPA: LPS export ABC transporter periplasmic protein LptC [Bacteroidetes bacterium]|jgi:LPS export ABC transporter protein LptC|nr:LPS export ABC transporter periplasmic protein LptC [Bacteroidota bacterium]
MNGNRVGSSLTIVLLVLFLVACEEKIRPSVVAVSQAEVPSQESWNSTVTFTDSGKVKAILWSGHIASFSERQYTHLSESIHVDFFDEFEKHTSLLTARRGKVNDRTQDFAAYENVVVISDSGTTLRTDSLFWDNATRKIRTEAFVDIVSPTEHIMGHGMISDQGLKKYTIFKVTGQAVTRD